MNASSIIGLDLHSWRFEGVTQRIALCYFARALLELWSGRRGQIVAIIACLLGYWALLRFAPVPGLGVPARDIRFMGIPIAISPHGSTANVSWGISSKAPAIPKESSARSRRSPPPSYWILEIKKWRGAWTMPILVFGMNAIAGFVADSLVYGPGYSFTVKSANGITLSWHSVAQARVQALGASPPNASLIYSLCAVLFGSALLWLLWRKRIFLKL